MQIQTDALVAATLCGKSGAVKTLLDLGVSVDVTVVRAHPMAKVTQCLRLVAKCIGT